MLQFGAEDDAHDDAVDGDDFAEDDGDEVFGADAGGFDAAAQDRGAGDEDAPVSMYVCTCLAGARSFLGRGLGGSGGL